MSAMDRGSTSLSLDFCYFGAPTWCDMPPWLIALMLWKGVRKGLWRLSQVFQHVDLTSRVCLTETTVAYLEIGFVAGW